MDRFDSDFYQPTPKESQVWQVCDSLYAEGKRITYQSIGERLLSLGLKRGSNTDICRYLASWKKHHYPKTNNKPKQTSTPAPTTANNDQTLNLVRQLRSDLQSLQSQLKQTPVPTPKSRTGSAQAKDNTIQAVLLDMIEKQHQRETHYLKALEHARFIQSKLQAEIEKYQHEAKLSVQLQNQAKAEQETVLETQIDSDLEQYDEYDESY